MEAELLTGNYCVSLTSEQWNRLNDLDYLDVVYPTLVREGAADIEYNEHFGRSIYFVAVPSDVGAIVRELQSLVEE